MPNTLRIAIDEQASQMLRASSAGDVELDAASARDFDFFVTHVHPATDDTMQRPVVLWRGNRRVVIDVLARHEDGVWRLEFGDERPDVDAPDRQVTVDGRLLDLATPVWVTDRDRLARWFNVAWCDVVGSEIEDELGWGWMRHVHPDDLVGLLEAYEDAQRESRGFAYVGRLADSDGRFRWAQVKAVPRLDDGEFCGFIGMCAIYGRVAVHSPRRCREFRVRDWGSWEVPPTDHDGRGVEIMHALSDEFELHHHTDGTEVVLRYVLHT